MLVDLPFCRGRIVQHHLHSQVGQLALGESVLDQPQQRVVAEISMELSKNSDVHGKTSNVNDATAKIRSLMVEKRSRYNKSSDWVRSRACVKSGHEQLRAQAQEREKIGA